MDQNIYDLLDFQKVTEPKKTIGEAFAPANIALCKYWGKRDTDLHLPVTSSLSISLGNKGTKTKIGLFNQSSDRIVFNNREIPIQTHFAKRFIDFLDLIRPDPSVCFDVISENSVPVEAGLASSASGFAALTLALNDLFGWGLDDKKLSILARFGSGSACRSLWHGFVKWNAGSQSDGMDSFAEPLSITWPELRIGLLMVSNKPKKISSREAMQRTVETSCFYSVWPDKVAADLRDIEKALDRKDFDLLGETAESNALSMHASMLASHPPIMYSLPETIAMMQKVWSKRHEGLRVYFTQDAGPNLKLLFLESEEEKVKNIFPAIDIISPFSEEHRK